MSILAYIFLVIFVLQISYLLKLHWLILYPLGSKLVEIGTKDSVPFRTVGRVESPIDLYSFTGKEYNGSFGSKSIVLTVPLAFKTQYVEMILLHELGHLNAGHNNVTHWISKLQKTEIQHEFMADKFMVQEFIRLYPELGYGKVHLVFINFFDLSINSDIDDEFKTFMSRRYIEVIATINNSFDRYEY